MCQEIRLHSFANWVEWMLWSLWQEPQALVCSRAGVMWPCGTCGHCPRQRVPEDPACPFLWAAVTLALAAVINPKVPPAACLSLQPAVPFMGPLTAPHPAWHALHALLQLAQPGPVPSHLLLQPPHLLCQGSCWLRSLSPGSLPITDLFGTCPCSV